MKFSIENILRDDRKELAVERTSISNASTELSPLEHRNLNDIGPRSSSPESSASCCSDDVNQDSNHRRPRTAITIWQRDRLEVLFDGQRYPAAEKIELISEQLGLPQHVVKVWFQNRRAKLRKEGIKRRKTTLPYTAPPSRDHQLHHIATVMRAAEYPRQINDKEIELVHSRVPSTSSARPSVAMEPSMPCPCCSPSMSQKQYTKPVPHDYLASFPTHYDDRYHSKLLHPLHPTDHHPTLSAMISDGSAQCCCINCRIGTYYAKY